MGRHGSAARRALAARPGERVLDLGCGPGLSAVALGSEVGSWGWVAAVDVVAEMADAARRRMTAAGTPAWRWRPTPAPPIRRRRRPGRALRRRPLALRVDVLPRAAAGLRQHLSRAAPGRAPGRLDLAAPRPQPVDEIDDGHGHPDPGHRAAPAARPRKPRPLLLADPDDQGATEGAGFAEVELASVEAPSSSQATVSPMPNGSSAPGRWAGRSLRRGRSSARGHRRRHGGTAAPSVCRRLRTAGSVVVPDRGAPRLRRAPAQIPKAA